MKRTNKKGFTIVELVIVIAVIAILAAVLIPNISRLVRKAQVSSDLSLVRNLNTALEVENATMDYPTAYSAFQAVKENGYDLAKIEAKASDNQILYDSANKCFVYLNAGKLEYYPNTQTTALSESEYYKLWAVYTDSEKAAKAEYSVYWNGDNGTVTVNGVGFDAGETNVNEVNYNGVSGKVREDIVIRTNSILTSIKINAEYDTVSHYDLAKSVTITKIANKSYHEYGSVSEVTLTSGRMVIEKGGLVAKLTLESGAECVNNGIIVNTTDTTRITGSGQTGIAANGTITIADANTLINLAYASNGNSISFTDKTLKLTADIDLNGKAWVPFGLDNTNAFKGIKLFDGQGYSIKGLKPDEAAKIQSYNSEGKTEIRPTGLIAYLDGNVVIKNLTVEINVESNSQGGFGAFIGTIKSGNVELENCTAKGSITGTDKLGGFIGSTYISEQGLAQGTGGTGAGNIAMKNCANYVSVTATGNAASARIGGFIGTLGFSGKATIENCSNNGVIANKNTSSGKAEDCVAGGFAGKMNCDYDLTVTNFVNKGTLTCDRLSGNTSDYIAAGNDVKNNQNTDGTTKKATFNGKHLKQTETNNLFSFAD